MTRKASGITPSDSRKTAPLKKACLTAGQPGAFETTRTMTAAKTSVLASAISVLLRPEVTEALLEDGRSGRVDPLLLELLDRPVRLERRDRLVGAVAQRVALLEDEPEVLLAGRQAPDDRCVRHLDAVM